MTRVKGPCKVEPREERLRGVVSEVIYIHSDYIRKKC